jgi:hypothetical protein
MPIREKKPVNWFSNNHCFFSFIQRDQGKDILPPLNFIRNSLRVTHQTPNNKQMEKIEAVTLNRFKK